MDNKVGRESEVIEKTKQSIAFAEEERKSLRFKYNFKEFAAGSFQPLKNDEFVKELIGYFRGERSENAEEDIIILQRLGEGTLGEASAMRERALAVLSPAAELFLGHKEKEKIFVLADIFCNWLEYEAVFLPGFNVINKRIEEISEWLLLETYWKEAEKLMVLQGRIQTGRLPKSAAIRSLVGKTLEKLTKKAIIEKLTDDYLLEDEKQEVVKTILVSLGERAAIFQLNKVIHSHSRRERLALIDLLPSYGDIAIPVLVDCLEKNPPWAVVRNIVYIISAIGADSNYPLIEHFFLHKDERVQHEMICCVMNLGGQSLKKRLIGALGVVSFRLKTHIIQLFVEHGLKDEEVFEAVCELAQNNQIISEDRDYEVLSAAITGLKAFPCSKSIDLLVKLRTDHEDEIGTEQLLLRIDEALMVIKPKVRHSLQGFDGFQEEVSFDYDPQQEQLALSKARKIEEEIQTLVGAGDMKRAGELIYGQSVIAAQAKDFSLAEMLRDRFLEINPLAMTKVIRLGELIEEQKSNMITSHHIEIWNELYEEMTTEEFNALYYSLSDENYRKGDIIVHTGETDSNLYFLNSGYISLSCVTTGQEKFLKRMQPSDVLGSEQFFAASVWTVSLRALSEVQVQVLGRANLEKIAEDHPGIEDTLRNYCLQYARIPELLKMSGDDRREYPRFPGILVTRNILLDSYGNKGKRSFKGELIDVSQRGLAFTIRISNKKNAKLLLGRQIITAINVDGEELPQCFGVIVGVRIHDAILQDFSVHVKLSKKMNDESFRKIISLVG